MGAHRWGRAIADSCRSVRMMCSSTYLAYIHTTFSRSVGTVWVLIGGPKPFSCFSVAVLQCSRICISSSQPWPADPKAQGADNRSALQITWYASYTLRPLLPPSSSGIGVSVPPSTCRGYCYACTPFDLWECFYFPVQRLVVRFSRPYIHAPAPDDFIPFGNLVIAQR